MRGYNAFYQAAATVSMPSLYAKLYSTIAGIFSSWEPPELLEVVVTDTTKEFPGEREVPLDHSPRSGGASEQAAFVKKLSALEQAGYDLNDALTTDHHYLFRKACKHIKLYSIVRTMLLKAGTSEEELQKLLNTSHPEEFFSESIFCTPLMALIFETIRHPPTDYTNFITLLLQFTADGAQLTDEQLSSININLDKLKKIIDVSPKFIELLNQWIEALPRAEGFAKANNLKKEDSEVPSDWVIEIPEEENTLNCQSFNG